MENVMSVEEKSKIIQFYSARLDRSSGSLGKYYAEIVDNMTYEDANKLLEFGTKYGFATSGDDYKAAFKVVLAYVATYFRSFNVFKFKKTDADFDGDRYKFLCARIDYYGNLIEELSDKNSVSSIMIGAISQCVSELYPELFSMELLDKLNGYLVCDASDLLKCYCECLYNNLSYRKKQFDEHHKDGYCLRRCRGIEEKDGHYISDNHM